MNRTLHRIFGHRFATRETGPLVRYCTCGTTEKAIITDRGVKWVPNNSLS